MPVSVTMPQLGESVTEGTVTRWLKAEGDTVQADEPLLEVSTDKVDTEIPSPATGVLTRIVARRGLRRPRRRRARRDRRGGRREQPSRLLQPPRAAVPEPEPVEAPAAAPVEPVVEVAPRHATAARNASGARRGDPGHPPRARRERDRGHGHPVAEGCR